MNLETLTPRERGLYDAEYADMFAATHSHEKARKSAEHVVEIDRSVRRKESPHSPEIAEHRSPLVKCANLLCAKAEAASMAAEVMHRNLTDWQRERNPSVERKWASLVLAEAFGQDIAASAEDISQPVIAIRKRQLRTEWPALFALLPEYAERLQAKYSIMPEGNESEDDAA
jgi:hypothetical protein